MFFNSKNTKSTRSTRSGKRAEPLVVARAVSDNRWVHRNQLEVGMYVNELDKPWEQTRFMFQGFKIDSLETLGEVQDACEYANVQTVKDALVPTNSLHRLVGAVR